MKRPPRVRQRNRMPLVGLLAAQGLSLAGNAITIIAIPLYVLHDTGSVMATGVTGVFATIPVVVGGAFGGVLVDRLGFRSAAIAADLASGVAVLAIPVVAASVGLPFWALLTLVFLSGVLDTPGSTAKAALLPDLAEAARLPLARAAGVQSAISRSASLVGASVAAVSVLRLGALNSLLLDAATFAVSAALLWFCVYPPSAQAAAHRDVRGGAVPRAGYWRELGDGIRFLGSKPIIRNLVLLIVVTNCFDAAGLLVLQPVYARTVSPDGAVFGIMVASFAFGALVGAGLFGWFGHRLPRRLVLLVCFVLGGAPPYFAMAFALPVPALLSVMGATGLMSGAINPLLSTVLYERIPRDMRARVLGAITTGVSAGMPVGSLLGGVVVSWAGLAPALVVNGIAYGLVTLTPLVGRSWGGLGTPSTNVSPGV